MGTSIDSLLGGKKKQKSKQKNSAISQLSEKRKEEESKPKPRQLSPFNPLNPNNILNQETPKPGVFNALKRKDTYTSAAKYGGTLVKDFVGGTLRAPYDAIKTPSSATKELERITGVSKLPTGLRQPLQAITRLVGAAPAGLGDYVGREIIGERMLANKVTRGELPADVLNTRKPNLTDVRDSLEQSMNTVLTFYGGGKGKAKVGELATASKVAKVATVKVATKATKVLEKTGTRPVEIIQTGKTGPGKKSSKIARSIEAKAIEQKLTKGFDKVAGYDPITIKQQAHLAAETLVDIQRTGRIVRGEEPVPQGLNPVSLITALEEHIAKNGDAKMAYELANSQLVSETSIAAQSLRLAAERNPDGLTAQLRSIKQAREASALRRLGPRAKQVATQELRSDLVKATPKAKDWTGFIQELKCK